MHQNELANRAAARLFGAPEPEALLGRSVLDFSHPDFREIIRERIRVQLEQGRPAPVMAATLSWKFFTRMGVVLAVDSPV